MSFTIKKLHTSDLHLARQLLEEWWQEDGIMNPATPGENYLKNQLSRDDFHVYVAIENDQVVGGLTANEIPMFDKEENEMFLFEIGVNEEFRRKGIAKALVKELKSLCVKKGIKVIFLGTSQDNLAAKQLYASTGAIVEIIPWYTYELDNSKK